MRSWSSIIFSVTFLFFTRKLTKYVFSEIKSWKNCFSIQTPQKWIPLLIQNCAAMPASSIYVLISGLHKWFYTSRTVSSASQTVDPGALLFRLAERRCASSRSWVFLGSPSGTSTKLRPSTVPECALLARVHRQLVKGRKNFVVDCCPQCNCTVEKGLVLVWSRVL